PTPSPSTLSLHDALPIFLERRIAGEVELAVHVQRQSVLDIERAVVAPVAVALVEAHQRSHAVGRRRGYRGRAGRFTFGAPDRVRSEEHTSELQSPDHLVC